jgi:hypothetical protein
MSNAKTPPFPETGGGVFYAREVPRSLHLSVTFRVQHA